MLDENVLLVSDPLQSCSYKRAVKVSVDFIILTASFKFSFLTFPFDTDPVLSLHNHCLIFLSFCSCSQPVALFSTRFTLPNMKSFHILSLGSE